MDPVFTLTLAATALAAIGIVTAASLNGFKQWVGLKQAELATHSLVPGPGLPQTAARIDIADLKERIRKLEAIAAGVEL